MHYVAERREGFLWSSFAKSTGGQTVVNVEAIQGAGNVDEFFLKNFDSWRASAKVSFMYIYRRRSRSA